MDVTLSSFSESALLGVSSAEVRTVRSRTAVAAGRVLVSREVLSLIREGRIPGGDVLTVSRTAGILGAGLTPDLIPACPPVTLTGIDLELSLDDVRCSVEITALVSSEGSTGAKMEALTAVSTAALTVYSLCRSFQEDIQITDICLLQNSAGASGGKSRGRCC